MSKTVAVIQSNYIPWKGYFDIINSVDEFIIFDSMQYTRRDWRNRNRIKTPLGTMWLTIPVEVKGKYFQRICDTRVSDPTWNQQHWRSIVVNYSRAKCFREYRDYFEALYLNFEERLLSQINYRFIVAICEILGIRTKISWSTDYEVVEGKTERLLHLCKQAGATDYLSGPAAKDYLDEGVMMKAGVKVRFMDYSGYPEYDQLYPPFEHTVSILDLVFNEGHNAPNYMKSFRFPHDHESA